MSKNITVPNMYVYSADHFMAIWKLTRAMKAAGWKYLASSDARIQKENSGIGTANGRPLLDMWGPGGIVANHVQLGSQGNTGSLTLTANYNQTTVSGAGLSGMTANSVGHALTISGATNAGNNGTFTIIGYTSASQVTIFNGNGVTETKSVSWSERISGTASITWSSISNSREQTISGLSRMTPDSAGRFIYLEGSSLSNNNGIFSILSYVSPSSVVIINNNTSSVGSDTASGNWTELDPLLDVYPIATNIGPGAWSLFQGPSTIKLPINAVSSGTFITNEIITQSGSGAQGTLLGYQFDSTYNYGYLVISPRKNGTSSSSYLGWAPGISTITGATSSATVTTGPSSVPSVYVREVCFWKYNITTGHIYNQCLNSNLSNENNIRMSSLTNAAGCTSLIAPAGGGTGNAFPLIGSYVVKGYGGAGSVSTGARKWIKGANSSYDSPITRSHIMVADADYSLSKSADGSFTIAAGHSGTTSATLDWSSANNPPLTGCYSGFGFHILDNTEPGDIDPYVWYVPHSQNANSQHSYYNESRAGATIDIEDDTIYVVYSDHFNTSTFYYWLGGSTPHTLFKGFVRRGYALSTTNMLGDYYQEFGAHHLCYGGIPAAQPRYAGPLNYVFSPNPDVVAHSISQNLKRLRDFIWIVSIQDPIVDPAGQVTPFVGTKTRKGTLRWITSISGGSAGQTYNNKTLVQLSGNQGNAGSANLALAQGNWVVGPWDGMSPVLHT